METIYWLMGYTEEQEADERQKHLKHLACRQIEDSKEISLKKVHFENTIKRKNKAHNEDGMLTYELKRLNMNANKKRRKKSNK